MNEHKSFEEFIRAALSNAELEVSPEIWAVVQSKIAAGVSGSASSAVLSGISKAAFVAGITAVTVLGTINETYNFTHPVSSTESVGVKVTIPPASTSNSEEIETVESNEFISESAKHVSEELRSIENSTDDPVAGVADSTAKTAPHMPTERMTEIASANSINASSELPKDEYQPEVPKPESSDNSPKSNVEPSGGLKPAEEKPTASIANFDHQPKSFISADGDGTNDCFVVNATSVQSFFIRIHDRNGQVLFESSDINFSWCGTDKTGAPLPARSVCFYEIIAIGTDNLPYRKPNAKGSITVFR